MSLKKEGGKNATCYVDKLVKIYPAFGKVLRDNTDMLKDKSVDEQAEILRQTMRRFETLNKGQNLKFRLHTSGDFFSREYAEAWKIVILEFPHISFWCYTRCFWAVPILRECPNLALYLSADPVNITSAQAALDEYGKGYTNIGIAYMGNKSTLPGDRKWVTCPELSGKVNGAGGVGACAKCRLCMTYSERISLRNIHFPVH